jgi:hypothetical protein
VISKAMFTQEFFLPIHIDGRIAQLLPMQQHFLQLKVTTLLKTMLNEFDAIFSNSVFLNLREIKLNFGENHSTILL